MRKTIIILAVCFSAFGCGKISEKAKNTINKGGETVGKGATEFFEGVSEGIDKTLQCDIVLSESLKNQGISTGKFSINNLSEGGSQNLLTLYLIFDKDFKSAITVKAFDKNGLEIGRAKLDIENQKGNAGYYDFPFDKRTYIEKKSKIVLE